MAILIQGQRQKANALQVQKKPMVLGLCKMESPKREHHIFGAKFAKAFDVKFTTSAGDQDFVTRGLPLMVPSS